MKNIKQSVVYLTGIRLLLLKLLFTEDEKFLLNRAVEDRINNLNRSKCTDMIDSINTNVDISDYYDLKEIFETKLT